jgi:hypothetical protein
MERAIPALVCVFPQIRKSEPRMPHGAEIFQSLEFRDFLFSEFRFVVGTFIYPADVARSLAFGDVPDIAS